MSECGYHHVMKITSDAFLLEIDLFLSCRLEEMGGNGRKEMDLNSVKLTFSK